MQRQILVISAICLSFAASAEQLNGRALFTQNCASCHGVDGKGGVGPKLVGESTNWTSKLFQRAVLKGIDDAGKKLEAPMPHWAEGSFKSDNGKAPTAKEVNAIYRYLRTVK